MLFSWNDEDDGKNKFRLFIFPVHHTGNDPIFLPLLEFMMQTHFIHMFKKIYGIITRIKTRSIDRSQLDLITHAYLTDYYCCYVIFIKLFCLNTSRNCINEKKNERLVEYYLQ